MRHELFVDGSDARKAWAAGRATCPNCQRFGCKGQCGCPCASCKQMPLDAWEAGCCDVIRDMRERATPEGRARQRQEYQEALAGRSTGQVTWGECVSQVERVGAPHFTLTVSRKPQSNAALEGAKQWWNRTRSAKPTLLLSGTTGSGKSVAAGWVAIKFAEARKWWVGQPSGPMPTSLVWLDAEEVTRLNLLMDDDERLVERAGAAEFLVIDDLGALGGKAGLLAMSQLIARRVDSGRPLVVTTNTSGAELAVALGKHVVDRMRQAHVVKLDEKSGRAA